MEDKYILLIGIAGAVLSPIITGLGLLLQHRRDKITADALATKTQADSEKIKAEAKAIDSQADKDIVNFWIGMVETLRAEVNALTELSRKNGGEISILTARLVQADAEKQKLARDNAELVKRVEELSIEVETLRKQVQK